MKSIKTKAIIEGIRSRKDRSVGLTVSTPELNPQEKALFFELQGLNVELVITPSDIEKVEDYQVEAELEQKSQSVRMRNVLFILWKQEPKGLEFSDFYKQQTEKLIEFLKGKIEA
jgi:hypothetical protein